MCSLVEESLLQGVVFAGLGALPISCPSLLPMSESASCSCGQVCHHSGCYPPKDCPSETKTKTKVFVGLLLTVTHILLQQHKGN